MDSEARFNLIEEDWIPAVDVGKVSLRRIFSDSSLRGLGGNPIHKISVLKLLLAISQAAYTPNDFSEWKDYSPEKLSENCMAYLESHSDEFFLYGPRPFLQIPAIKSAELQSFGAVLPEIATGNTTILNNSQLGRVLDDGEKALILVQLSGFSLAGKKTDNSVVLSPGYMGKVNEKGNPSSGKAGASIGYFGHLHNFVLAETILDSLYLNLFTKEEIEEIKMFEEGIGIPPWEQTPKGEDCETAKRLKNSYMGRLVPLSRFVLLKENGLHLSEGIAHFGYKEGKFDPSIAVNNQGKIPKSIWTNPEKRPWRNITSLLSFLSSQSNGNFIVYQLRFAVQKAREKYKNFILWSGGIKVSSNAGEQYCSGGDDFVDSSITIDSEILGKDWFAVLQSEMEELENLSKLLYGRVMGYYNSLQSEGKQVAGKATSEFWILAEGYFFQLLDACEDTEKLPALRRNYAGIVQECYEKFCPKSTARQIEAWAENQPRLGKYVVGRDVNKAS